MWKKSGKTESFSEPLRAGRIRVRETARRAPLGLAGLLALFCGAGAVLLLADAAFNLLVFDCGTALLFAAGTSVLVWATRLFARHRGLWACAAAGVAALAVWLWRPDLLRPKWRLLWSLAWNDPHALVKFDMTEILCLAAVAVVLLFYLLAFVFRIGWAAYGLTIPLLAAAASLGVLPLWSVPMLLLFHAQAHLEAAQWSRGSRMAGRGSLLLAGLLCAAFFGCYALLQPHMDAILALPRRVQEAVLPDNTDADDRSRTSAVSSGRYTTGDDALALTLTARPDEPLYLRNFWGGVYEEGRWSVVDESAFDSGSAGGVQFRSEGYTWFSDDADAADGLEILPESGVWMAAGADMQTLLVTRLNGSGPGDYTPYGAVLLGTDGNVDQFAYYAPESGQPVDQPNNPTLYARFAENAYMDVPDSLGRLRAFCRENPRTGFEDVRDFILRTLHSTTEYTLSPGLVPPGADPAEYFLFTNHRGYCEHYATTAALLFRLYGYPSRYVTGYVADDFRRQTDGTYQAVLTDRQAHAWVEVFVNGEWVLVEATPAGSVVEPQTDAAAQESAAPTATPEPTPTATPAPTEAPESGATEGPATPTPAPQATERPAQPTPRPEESPENTQFELPGWGLPALAAVLCAAASVLIAAALCRRRRRRRCADAREMLAQSLKRLQRAGLLRGMDGTERDFAARLCEAVPQLRPEQAEKLQADALRSAFGGAGALPADPEIYTQCRKAAASRRRKRR